MPRFPSLLLAAACLAALPACTGGKPDARPTPTATAVPSPDATCPPGDLTASGEWPPEVPADLPMPRGARIEKVERTQTGVVVVRFQTRNSLREGVLHVVREFPKFGYTLGRGDAEVTEADAPFQKGDVRGLVRMLAREECQTLWLLAVSRASGFTGGAPFAPNYTPPASSSPLPFG